MATLAKYNGVAQDAAGNALGSPSVQVTLEGGGLVPLYSDRAGAVPISNPFFGAADGTFSFHVASGAYRIDVISGAVTRTLRYVGIGTAAEYDGTVFINANRATVRVATTANITIATALNATDVIDGVTLANGDRVLVKDQTTPSQNGVYVVSATPARATDFATFDSHAGALLAVTAGTANANKMFWGAVNVGKILNTDPIVFAQVPGSTGPAGANGADGSAVVIGTSASSLAIGTGSKTFSVTEGSARGWSVGARLRQASAANPSVDFMEGVVTAYAHPSLTVLVDKAAGGGTHTDWLLNLAGEVGPIGPVPTPVVVTIADSSSTTFDAQSGTTTIARLTATGDRTLTAPTNPADGQKVIIEHIASGAARTLTLTVGSAGAFRFGSSFLAISQTASGKLDRIAIVYNAAANRWDVLGDAKGF